MFVKMLKTYATPTNCFLFRHRYDVEDAIAADWIAKSIAEHTTQPPTHIEMLLARLDVGAGEDCLFLPFVGEFGHEIMSHIRMVHFHKASTKVVCCRPGNEVLYPSADSYVTDWTDPITDAERVGTIRDQVIAWPDLIARFPQHRPIAAGNLSFEQEMHCIGEGEPIPFRPKLRGLTSDVVFGIRNRKFAPEKNWQHWQALAAACRSAGLTYAVIGGRDTSADVDGQVCHTGDLDTDAAIELLQQCRLYIGTDSGGSHLASTVGAPMLVFREPRNGMRDFVPRMARVNPGRVQYLADGWDKPQDVAEAMLATIANQKWGPV